MLVWFETTEVEGLARYITGVAVVPIRVPTPITTSTRSSIHFIEKPQKRPPFRGELIRPSSHGEDGGRLWIKRSVSPHRFDAKKRRNRLRLSNLSGNGPKDFT